jgi:hypothetical protein
MKKTARDIVLILSLQCSVVLILAGLVTLTYVYRKPLLITYHKHGQRSAQKAMRRSWESKGPHDKYLRQHQRWQRHRKALIDLGYLERRKFNTQYLKANSPQTEKMLEEFRRHHPRASYSVGGREGLAITDRPSRMPTWESLIRKYDVLPSDPCQPTNPAVPEEITH